MLSCHFLKKDNRYIKKDKNLASPNNNTYICIRKTKYTFMSHKESTLSRLKNEVLTSKTSTKWMEPLVYLLPVAAITIFVVILIEESMTKSPIPVETQRSAYGWIALILIVWFFVSILFFLDRVPLLFTRARMNKKESIPQHQESVVEDSISSQTTNASDNEKEEVYKEILSVSKMEPDVEPTDQSGENIGERVEEPTEAKPIEASESSVKESPSISIPLTYPEDFQGCDGIFEELIQKGYCHDTQLGHLHWDKSEALLAYFIYFCSSKLDICNGERISWHPFISIFGLDKKRVELLRSTISKATTRSTKGDVTDYKKPKDHKEIEKIVEDNC